ncbi:hypothetical protein [Aureibaculum sp. 2210JD6-5]|uniref:hypothetical protein n=1 Tax=Aureibaculum sp. 2210JD6-5 TaxID=3103957 RepID=UPI002ABDC6B6|nr:hypothetical protein [Aureibaculum sp. 2210JD6-5]
MIQCKEETNYTLGKEQVGKITSATQIRELYSIFENDSIVSHLGEDNVAESTYDEYLVYNKNGDHLLTIIPKIEQDSSSTIENIQIFDKNYKTVKGLNIRGTFKDIVDNYTVNKVQSTFSTAVLFVDELNATITIEKKELGVNDFGTQKIKLEQIPDLAKIKGITMWFK